MGLARRRGAALGAGLGVLGIAFGYVEDVPSWFPPTLLVVGGALVAYAFAGYAAAAIAWAGGSAPSPPVSPDPFYVRMPRNIQSQPLRSGDQWIHQIYLSITNKQADRRLSIYVRLRLPRPDGSEERLDDTAARWEFEHRRPLSTMAGKQLFCPFSVEPGTTEEGVLSFVSRTDPDWRHGGPGLRRAVVEVNDLVSDRALDLPLGGLAEI